MSHNTFIQHIATNQNAEKAVQMSAYMRNKFTFLGITAQQRNELSKEYLKTLSKKLDWNFIDECWENPYREMQYIACDYVKKRKKHLQTNDLQPLKRIITTKSWWDTVDILAKPIGHIVFENPNLKKTMLKWSVNDNIWIRRTAILHQLSQKTTTDTELLAEIISNNFNQTEFFINKAIGWALRDYSKTNPNWVKDFLIEYKAKLAPLSFREGSKYVKM